MSTQSHSIVFFAVCMSFLALAGCGSDDLVDSILEEIETTSSLACDCYETLEYETREACVADQETPSAMTSSCIREVYADNQDALDPSFSCLELAYREVNDCLRSAMCSELNDCVVMLAGIEECPDVPEALQDQLDACDP